MFDWLRKFRKKKKFYPTPKRFGVIEFMEEAKDIGLSIKQLIIFNDGKVEDTFDYSKTVINALQKYQHLPIFDSTGGKLHPKSEVFVTYDPSSIDLRF